MHRWPSSVRVYVVTEFDIFLPSLVGHHHFDPEAGSGPPGVLEISRHTCRSPCHGRDRAWTQTEEDPGVDDWDTARDCLDIRMVQNHEMSDRSTGLPSRLYSSHTELCNDAFALLEDVAVLL